MADNTEGFITKADLQVLLASMQQETDKKLQAREAEFKKELDIQANKIHSSYAKKLKTVETDPEEISATTDGSPARKPTKKELEMQENIEKLVRRAEESEARAALAAQRNVISDTLLKNGINPEAVETVYTLLDARKAFVDGKMKVSVDGTEVALPVDQAVKYFVKSPEAKFFLAPKGAVGSGGKTPVQTTPTNGSPKPRVEVDWASVAADLAHTSNS